MSTNQPPSNENVVLTERVTLENSEGQVLVITLNRPDRLNCFNTQVCQALCKIFSSLSEELWKEDSTPPLSTASDEDDDEPQQRIVAVILTGTGRSFCAGADLANPPDPLTQSSDLKHHLIQNPVHHMGKVSVPIIGAIQGHCYTGGFELALACDILIGNSTTKFKDTHVKFGLAPCWGLSQKLQRRVGPGRAKLASFTASVIHGETAYKWGLLDDYTENKNASLLDRALEIAEQIGENDSTMVRRYKRAIVEGGGMDLNKGLQRERELGFVHYWEVTSAQSSTMDNAKEFITDQNRNRSKL